MPVPYVHSGYERNAEDHYPTIDERCTYALLEHFPLQGRVIDICAPTVSGITQVLRTQGAEVLDWPDAFTPWDYRPTDIIVTNPPYSRPTVDRILDYAKHLVEQETITAAAFLMRTNFDHAQSRKQFFTTRSYHGQIKLLFRPWWSEERQAHPIHNYVWHIWRARRPAAPPSVWYGYGGTP